MRLIDADALMRDIEHYHLSDGKFQHWVEVQPTIEPQADHIAKTGKMDKVITADLYGYRVPPEQLAECMAGKGGKIKPEEIWKDRPCIIRYSTTVRRYIIPLDDRGMPDFIAEEEDKRGAARLNQLFNEEDDTEERVSASLQDGVKQIAHMFCGNKKGKP